MDKQIQKQINANDSEEMEKNSSPTYTGTVPGKIYGMNDEVKTGYCSDPLTNNQNQDKAPRVYIPTNSRIFV